MSGQKNIAVVGDSHRTDERRGETPEERREVAAATRRRTERRVEIGFFIRKIVNGWVTFYKQFPPEKRTEALSMIQAQSGKEKDKNDDVSSGGATTRSGTGGGTGDNGPIGGARYEAGFFLSATTTETGDDGAEE